MPSSFEPIILLIDSNVLVSSNSNNKSFCDDQSASTQLIIDVDFMVLGATK